MSRTYEALSLAKTQTQLSFDAPGEIHVTASFATTLADELAQIERVVGYSIGKLKIAVSEGAKAACAEQAQTEQRLEELKASVAALESKLQETERSLQERDSAVEQLATKLDHVNRQNEHLEQSLQQAKTETATQAQRAALVAADANTRVAALQARLVESESAGRAKETALNNLELQLTEKEKALSDSHQQIGALQAQLSRLKEGVREMAAAMARQLELLAAEPGSHHAVPSTSELEKLNNPQAAFLQENSSGAAFVER